MKLSEAIMESLNDIDPVYLEKSEKEYGKSFGYRRLSALILSAAAVLLLFWVMPKPAGNMNSADHAPIASEEMKTDSEYDGTAVMETAGGSAADAGAEAVIVIRLLDEKGQLLPYEEVQKVQTVLREKGYEAEVMNDGSLRFSGSEEELQACLEETTYSYTLEQQ